MSPFRNDIEKAAKRGNIWLNRKRLASAMHRLARWAKVDDVDMTWQVENGPWFDNGVMIITFDGRSAVVDVEQAQVTDGGDQVLDHALAVRAEVGAGPGRGRGRHGRGLSSLDRLPSPTADTHAGSSASAAAAE